MEPSFWHQRWQAGQTGWHQDEANRFLRRHWDRLAVPAGGTVLVPLCGMSWDLVWLARRGHRVVGVELSEVAAQRFFAEAADATGFDPGSPEVREQAGFRVYAADGVEIWTGDVFALAPDAAPAVDAVYDRAALIALPPDQRRRYAAHLTAVAPGAPQLLVNLEYPEGQLEGPPFAVPAAEVRRLYGTAYTVTELGREDALAKAPNLAEKGVTELQVAAFLLKSKHPSQ